MRAKEPTAVIAVRLPLTEVVRIKDAAAYARKPVSVFLADIVLPYLDTLKESA